MKKFKIVGVRDSKIITLYLKENSQEKVLQKLQKDKIALIDIKEVASKSLIKASFDDELILCFKHIAILLDSFMPIDEILQFCIKNSSNKFGEILENVLRDLKSGKKLSESFEAFGNSINPLYKTLIAIGERSARLPEIFSTIVRDMEEKRLYKKKIKKILFYPLVVFLSIAITFICGVLFIIPEFRDFFMENHLELPWITRSLLFLENFLHQFGIFILVIFLLIIFISKYLYAKNLAFHHFVDRFLLNIPFFGKIILYFKYHNFLQALHFLQSCGNDLNQSLDISKKILDNTFLEQKILQIIQELQKGNKLSEALENDGIFDDIALGLIKGGEKSGRLEAMFLSVSKYYEEKYQDLLDRFLLYLEPLCSFLIALVVLYLALGIFMPIWSLQDMQIF